MLYFRALEQGLSNLPQADEGIRQQLLEEAEKIGWEAMHRRLAAVDPAAARRIHPNDPQRIQRALEVHAVTGRPLSELQQRPGETMPYRALKLVLAPPDRATLHAHIDRRFLQMLETGLVEEVERLVARGDLDPELPSMRSVGYRQVWRWLRGETARDQMVREGQAATRQLARRQLTWLRKEPGTRWLAPADDAPASALAMIRRDL